MPRLINNVAVSRSFWSKNTYFIFSDIKNGPLFEIGQETIYQIKLATLEIQSIVLSHEHRMK